jgi:polar amino acid transport system substrate-binding protein/glutamate/aspartate transport system substrate-binding protein
MDMLALRGLRVLWVGAVVMLGGAVLLSGGARAGVLDNVRDTGVFKIGYRTDAAPYSYKNDGGEPAGYVVDLCREVAAAVQKEAGREVKVEYVVVTAEDRFDAVQSGKIDLLCEATSATLARRKLVDFSLMTFIDGASVMVREDGPQSFAGMAGQKIGVRAGTTTEAALRRSLADNNMKAEVVAVADHGDGLKKLESGEVAAYFADRAILSFLLIGPDSPKNLMVAKDYLTREPYALALARGDDDFRLLVDQTLARLYRSKKIDKIFGDNFGKAKPSDVLRALYVINALPE